MTQPFIAGNPTYIRKIVAKAPPKIEQARAVIAKNLPQMLDRFDSLVEQLMTYGITPYINAELGKILAQAGGFLELEVSESPEWSQALIECDKAFLGNELKEMLGIYGWSPKGGKKEMCRWLYKLGQPDVVQVMEPFLSNQNRVALTGRTRP